MCDYYDVAFHAFHVVLLFPRVNRDVKLNYNGKKRTEGGVGVPHTVFKCAEKSKQNFELSALH